MRINELISKITFKQVNSKIYSTDIIYRYFLKEYVNLGLEILNYITFPSNLGKVCDYVLQIGILA